MSGAGILRVVVDRVIGAGHSMGANGAIIAGRYLDRVVALAPGWPKGDNDTPDALLLRGAPGLCTAPTLVMVGSNDGITGPDAALANFDLLPNDKRLITILGGNHVQFMDDGIPSRIGGLFDGKAEITGSDQLVIAKREMLAWCNAV